MTPRNEDVLAELASNLSTPGHPAHRQFLSYDEAQALAANRPATNRVLNWLTSEAGVTITDTHPHGRYIHARAPVSAWERVLNTRFARFTPACSGSDCPPHRRRLAEGDTGGQLCATGDVSVPSHVASDVGAVHGHTCSLANRLQPLLKLDAECRGDSCSRGYGALGNAANHSFEIHGDAAGGLYLDRSALDVLFPSDGGVDWMDPPQLSRRYCDAFAQAHFLNRDGPLCHAAPGGIDDCTQGHFAQAGRLRIFG